MRISTTADELAGDLAALGRLGDEAMAQAAERLAAAMASPVAARLVELVSRLAAELDATLTDARAEVRIAGDDVRIAVVRDEEPAGADEPGDDDSDARITLRLSTRLKGRLEQAAAAQGVSLNTFIVRALGQPSTGAATHGFTGRRRMTGFGQS